MSDGGFFAGLAAAAEAAAKLKQYADQLKYDKDSRVGRALQKVQGEVAHDCEELMRTLDRLEKELVLEYKADVLSRPYSDFQVTVAKSGLLGSLWCRYYDRRFSAAAEQFTRVMDDMSQLLICAEQVESGQKAAQMADELRGAKFFTRSSSVGEMIKTSRDVLKDSIAGLRR